MASLYKLLGYPLNKKRTALADRPVDSNSFTTSIGTDLMARGFRKKINIHPKKNAHPVLWSSTTGGARPWNPRHAKYMGFRSNLPF